VHLEHAPKQPVPLFPLPDLVLFPGCVVPVHVLEQRDRSLVRDAVCGDRTIALALLKPGWEHDDQGSSAFHPMGCLAHLERVRWQPDDSYDLLVTGLSRVRFRRVTREYPYRAASVTLIPQEPFDEDDPLVQIERQALSECYGRLPGVKLIRSSTDLALFYDDGHTLSFECYVNSVCAQLQLDAAEKLALLELDSVFERARRLRKRIELKLRPAERRTGEQSN
jgi:Lon protease-like protein